MCIYFPEWSLDVARRKLHAKDPQATPHPAILLTTNIANQSIVMRACKVARQSGVKKGISSSLARALAPKGSYFDEFNPLQDANALRALAVWCLKFSPIVGLDNDLNRELNSKTPDKSLLNLDYKHYGITLDLTGTERLHGDPFKLCQNLYSIFKGSAKIAIAPTIAGAWALSRYSHRPICCCLSINDLKAAVNNLPVSSLRIEDNLIEKLSDIGVFTVGDLESLPRCTLSDRFGKKLLYRLALLNGSMLEPISSVSPVKTFIKKRTFEPPLSSRKSIVSAIEAIFLALFDLLRSQHLSAKRYSLTVKDTEGNINAKELSLASAGYDTSRMISVIYPIIEGLSFCGEIHFIAVEALDTSLVSPEQEHLNATKERDEAVAARAFNDLLNAFSLRLGRDRILKASLTTSYIPERSFRYESAISGLNSPDTRGELSLREPTNSYNPHNIPLAAPEERPTLLFSKPEPITSIAMLPDKPPSWIRWRGQRLIIEKGFGPERIAPEWWRSNLVDLHLDCRDYFTVQDSFGRWLWLFRQNNGDDKQIWFVHGVWT